MSPASSGPERNKRPPEDEPILWPDPSPLDMWWQRVMSGSLRGGRRAPDSSGLRSRRPRSSGRARRAG